LGSINIHTRGEFYMLKKHQFWAVVAIIGMVMCMITGHAMVAGHKSKACEE
jgi:hypothetical protein